MADYYRDKATGTGNCQKLSKVQDVSIFLRMPAYYKIKTEIDPPFLSGSPFCSSLIGSHYCFSLQLLLCGDSTGHEGKGELLLLTEVPKRRHVSLEGVIWGNDINN